MRKKQRHSNFSPSENIEDYAKLSVIVTLVVVYFVYKAVKK